MKYFDEIIEQQCKYDNIVCGDMYLCKRTAEGTLFILCDGIGSGIYANVAAIACAYRLQELSKDGRFLRSACETVAESMNPVRTEEIPFAAFTAVNILPGGEFVVYTYEAPPPILVSNGTVLSLDTQFYSVGEETLGESWGTLDYGDSLMLISDGVTQAGMGHGFGLGIGNAGIEEFVQKLVNKGTDMSIIASEVLKYTCDLCAGQYEDDTTVAVLQCRAARELTILTGPPMLKASDKLVAERFLAVPGKRVVCGSTTTTIISRESGRPAQLMKRDSTFGSPPEYHIDGVDMATEGAVVLNQVYNIMNEPQEEIRGDTPAERLYMMLREADVIRLMIGGVVNDAHCDLIFKQIGIHPRKFIVDLIRDELLKHGKMIIEEKY